MLEVTLETESEDIYDRRNKATKKILDSLLIRGGWTRGRQHNTEKNLDFTGGSIHVLALFLSAKVNATTVYYGVSGQSRKYKPLSRFSMISSIMLCPSTSLAEELKAFISRICTALSSLILATAPTVQRSCKICSL
jgi:hypothetical protein